MELFQRGCMDKLRSGDFSIQTWFIPLEAFASKKYCTLYIFIGYFVFETIIFEAIADNLMNGYSIKIELRLK